MLGDIGRSLCLAAGNGKLTSYRGIQTSQLAGEWSSSQYGGGSFSVHCGFWAKAYDFLIQDLQYHHGPNFH